MKGFLGTTADLLSDVLILALVVILPALVAAIVLAMRKRFAIHKKLMLAIFTVLVLYVIVYEANLIYLGGINYLLSNTRVPQGPYLALLIFHIIQSALTLVLGGAVISRGGSSIEQRPVIKRGVCFCPSQDRLV